jgi:hypothetical protein
VDLKKFCWVSIQTNVALVRSSPLLLPLIGSLKSPDIAFICTLLSPCLLSLLVAWLTL